jgi:multiple sugar transport system permease protein
VTTATPTSVDVDTPGVETPPTRRRRKVRPRHLWPYLGVLFAAVVVLPPVLWIISTAMKPETDTVMYPPQWIPDTFTWSNFSGVLNSTNIRFFINSIVAGVGSITLAIGVGIPVAYIATWYRTKRTEMFMTTVLILSMVPGMAILVALYAMFVRTSLMNTYPFLILVYTGLICGQTVLFLRSFVETIPVTLGEAALIDGCTRSQVLRKIVFPLIRPGLAAIAIFIFIFVWNDYLVGTILTTSESMRTVQNGLVRYVNTGYGNYWGMFSAYAVLAFAPVLAIFAAFQRWFIAGMTAGGVKG